MLTEREIQYLYEHVFSKMYYDKINNRYVIRKEDYAHLNLSTKQIVAIKKICKKKGIIFESPSWRLPSVEDEALFQEYNDIKTKIKENPNSKDIESLEKRKIEIRNKIVTDNLKLVRAIINRNLEGIQQMPNKEEIYQLGYELLLSFVDSRDIVKPKVFTTYISSKLISELKEKLTYIEYGIPADAKKDFDSFIKNRKDIAPISPKTKNISRKFGKKEQRAKERLNLERLLDTISIDAERDKLELHTDNSPLYNGHFEEELIKSTARDIIIKIINTLPEQQRNVLMLSFGFEDGYCYNDIEIAEMYGLTNARIGIIRHNALDNLRLSIRSKYLQDFYEVEKSYQPSISEEPLEEKQARVLQEVLIKHIPQKELLEYLNNLKKIESEVLLLILGLKDGRKHTLESIAEILNLPLSNIFAIKLSALDNLRRQILDKHLKDTGEYITNKEYHDYLIKTYVIHKRRSK